MSNPAQLFGSNGCCQHRFVAVEYDSLGGSPLGQLEALVDETLARTGFDQIVLAGHSQAHDTPASTSDSILRKSRTT